MKMAQRNRKKRDCGVVAIYNAAKWCNDRKTYREIEQMAKSCGYSEKRGLYYFQFANLVAKSGLPAKQIRPKDLNDLENRLYKGKFFILLYTPTGSKNGHAMSAFVDHQGVVKIVNPMRRCKNWFKFGIDITLNGVKDFVVYEIPKRERFL